MSKLPAFQFYPADWRKSSDVQAMPFFDRGVWFEILCLMHESDERGRLMLSGKPMTDDVLARLLGLSRSRLAKSLEVILGFAVAMRDSEGALCNRRMMRDEEIRKVRTEAGRLGGNPNLLNQTPKQKPTPSSSVSSSVSSSEESSPIGEVQKSPLSEKPDRKFILPITYQPTVEMVDWAAVECPALSATKETDEFVTFWRDIATKNNRRTERGWHATWKNRMKDRQERCKQNGNNSKHTRPDRRTDAEKLSDSADYIASKYSN